MGGANGLMKTLAENVVTFLQGNNTVGAADYLSNGLAKALEDANIIVGKPDFGKPLTQFPCVFVKVSTYHDDISALSPGADRTVDYDLEIWPATSLVKAEDRSAPMKENYQLTDNIVGLIRAKEDLSMTGHWVDSVDVTLDEEVESGVNVYLNRITLHCHELAL